MTLKCAELIEKIRAKTAEAQPDGKATFVYQLNVTVDGKLVQQYTLDLKNMKAYDGPSEGTPDVTITIDDETLLNLTTQKTTTDEAKANGLLKVEGNEDAVKLIKEVVQKHRQNTP